MRKRQASNSPRISVNKLAEFMTAKPARQRQILRDQKYPSDFKVVFYKEASEGMSIPSNFKLRHYRLRRDET